MSIGTQAAAHCRFPYTSDIPYLIGGTHLQVLAASSGYRDRFLRMLVIRSVNEDEDVCSLTYTRDAANYSGPSTGGHQQLYPIDGMQHGVASNSLSIGLLIIENLTDI
jgi:hypothetical protein